MPDRPPETIGKRDSHDSCGSESMPRPVPMTPAERQARPHGTSPWAEAPPSPAPPRQPHAARATAAAPPVAAQTLGGSGCDPDRPAGRIPCLAGQPRPAPGQALPTSLNESRLAEKLQAIAELDLEELQAIEPPRGYGRD